MATVGHLMNDMMGAHNSSPSVPVVNNSTPGSRGSVLTGPAGSVGGSVNGLTDAAPILGSQINNAQQSLQAGSSSSTSPENLNDNYGRRVRLRAKPNAASTIYGASGGLMTPLMSTTGMVFPYQPTITYQQDITYSEMELIHANQDIQAYKRTPSLRLSVEGEFSVQNQVEGQYALACIHFLRTVSKMYFGNNNATSSAQPGTPPPVLLFDAYGAYMFNSLPVILTSFTIGLPKEVDYIPVDMSQTVSLSDQANWKSISQSYFQNTPGTNTIAWLPALFSISIQIIVQNTPARLRAFSLDSFRSGALLQQGSWV